MRACDYSSVKSKEQITYEDLKKLIAENKAVFIKPLVFVLACVAFYFIIPILVFISQVYVFLPGNGFVETLLWTSALLKTLISLWNWDLS